MNLEYSIIQIFSTTHPYKWAISDRLSENFGILEFHIEKVPTIR